MKESRFIILSALAMLLSFSCETENIGKIDTPAADFSPVFVQIEGDDACHLSWEDSDTLKCWYLGDRWAIAFPYGKLLATDPYWQGVGISRVQEAVQNSSLLKRYGFWTASSDYDSGELPLKPLFSVLRISIDASGTILSDKSFTSLSVQSDIPICGNAVLDIPSDSIIIAPAGKIVRLVAKDSVSFSDCSSLYAVLWPGKQNHLNLEISCTQGFHLSASFDTDITLARGSCTVLQLPLSSMIAEGTAAIEVERLNLSENGTSNCYVVSDGGYYKFQATRGNSSVAPSDLKTVDWLWRDTSEPLIDEIELSKDGYVLFHALKGKGNTIIAGFDDSSQIVWSWHIWFTDDPAESPLFGVSSDYRLLDRNLGATSTDVDDIASYGFYYQWGRKDPFIGSAHLGYATATKRIENPGFTTATPSYWVNPAYSEHGFRIVANTSLPDGGEINYLIHNPMLFVTGPSWFYSTDNLTANKSLWGWDGNKTYVKSSYDPCPPGWKVPANLGGVELSDLNFAVASKASLYGMEYTGSDGSKTLFPATGARDYQGGYVTYAGWVGRYWGSLYREKSLDCWTLTLEGDPFNPKQAHVASSTGVSVRCIKE